MEKVLDICIVAFKRKGLEQIASLSHPRIEGVRYIVAWQNAGDDVKAIPEELSERSDFLVIPNSTVGSGANRSEVLKAAEAPLVLLSDDDVSYEVDYIKNLISLYSDNPDADFIIGNYHSDKFPKNNPDYSFDMRNEPKGFSFGGPVISFRLKKVREIALDFNPLFGVGSEFCCGEDTIFVYQMMLKGLRGRYFPVTLCNHEGASTAQKMENEEEFIRAKGAIFCYIHPRTWILRMLTHTLRVGGGIRSKLRYGKAWWKGVKDLKKVSGRGCK